jgi:hypothetical protein
MLGFTPRLYADLVSSFLDLGYEVKGYSDALSDQKHLILRHDIDMSLQYAAVIADIESHLNVYGTYFVLVRSELYNPLSRDNLKIIRELVRNGHEVGLHLDAALYGNSIDELSDAVELECSILESMTGKAVRVVSFHRPAKVLLGWDGALAGREHTYSPKFFNNMGYCSDSRGQWYYGHPLDHTAIQRGQALQLLTHPIWWCGFEGELPVEKIDRFVFNSADRFRSELAQQCTIYRKEIMRHLVSDSNQA